MGFVHRLILIAGVLVCMALVAGCVPEDRYDLPQTVETVLSQERLGEMDDMGLTVYDGHTPSDISGTYAWNDTTWVVAPRQENVGRSSCSGHLTLERGRTTAYDYQRQYDGQECVGGGSGTNIPMSGDGGCFSLFLRTTETVSGCRSNQVEVISGCLGEDGIEDFESGWFVDAYQSDACQSLVDEGQMPPQDQIVIEREGDGLAERQPQ